jgi:hypothetical protein
MQAEFSVCLSLSLVRYVKENIPAGQSLNSRCFIYAEGIKGTYFPKFSRFSIQSVIHTDYSY